MSKAREALTDEEVLRMAPMAGNFTRDEIEAFCAGVRRGLVLTTPEPEAAREALSDARIDQIHEDHSEVEYGNDCSWVTTDHRAFARAILAATPTDAARAPAPQDAQALRDAVTVFLLRYDQMRGDREEAGEFTMLRAALTQSAPQASPLPMPGSPEASAMMDSMLAEYGYPANMKNAARAGFEAARRLLVAPAAPLQPACPQCKGSGTMTATVGEGPDGWPQDFECNKCAGLGAIDAAPLQAEPEASGNAESAELSRKERMELELRRDQMARSPFCSDHRDKLRGLSCRQCEVERLSAKLRATTATPAAREAAAGESRETAKYDDVLIPFVALMRAELHANAAKGDRPGWLTMTPDRGLLEIYWHTAKLSVAVRDGKAEAIREHAADVANMAMMLLDVCGGLSASQPAAREAESGATVESGSYAAVRKGSTVTFYAKGEPVLTLEV